MESHKNGQPCPEVCTEHEFMKESLKELVNTIKFELKESRIEAQKDRRELIESVDAVIYLKNTYDSINKEFKAFKTEMDGKVRSLQKDINGWATARRFIFGLALFLMGTGIWQIVVWLTSIYKTH